MPSLEQPPKPAGRGPARTLAECALFSAAIVLVRVKVMAAPAQRLTTRLPHGAPVSARLRPMSVSLRMISSSPRSSQPRTERERHH
jgi:hypothetical protein